MTQGSRCCPASAHDNPPLLHGRGLSRLAGGHAGPHGLAASRKLGGAGQLLATPLLHCLLVLAGRALGLASLRVRADRRLGVGGEVADQGSKILEWIKLQLDYSVPSSTTAPPMDRHAATTRPSHHRRRTAEPPSPGSSAVAGPGSPSSDCGRAS